MQLKLNVREAIARARDRLVWQHTAEPRPLVLVVLAILCTAGLWTVTGDTARFFAPRAASRGTIAALFTPEVAHWEPYIERWATEYKLEPNLLATVMQIESCGHPTVNSVAGAQGLFQVMPFHFDDNEDMLDPDTNAKRGANFLNQCLNWSSGDVGLAMACYNGGPSVIRTNSAYWVQEVRDYYYWGTEIYADALAGSTSSNRLSEWLVAGGNRLCRSASQEIGLR